MSHYNNQYRKYVQRYLRLKHSQIGGDDNAKIKLEKLEKMINKKFQTLLRGWKYPKDHLFFESHEWYLNMLKMWKEDGEKWAKELREEDAEGRFSYDPNVDLGEIKSVDCKYIPKETMTKEMLEEAHKLVADPENYEFETIRKTVDKMFDYNLPSTIPNLDDYIRDKVRANKYINVVIAGAGPVGLYTALYLQKYYMESNLYQNFNILLIDNRVAEEGVKLPYSRITEFGFDISQFQPFIPQIFCWKDKNIYETRQFDFIYLLENLLYLTAYHKKIPMYFTKRYETFDKLQQFALDNGYHYILDCTGGRLGANLVGNVRWNDFNFKKDNLEVKYTGKNMYEFFVDGKKYKSLTMVLYLLDKNYKPFSTGNIFSIATNEEDERLIEKYMDNCYKKQDFIRIVKQFQDDDLRYLYSNLLHIGINDKKVKYVKLTAFDSNSHHVNRVAKVIEKDLMYIGLGNTLGSSEYGIKFGMHGAIDFVQQVCSLLGWTV